MTTPVLSERPPQRALTYRPDIDGLRAIAVLSVIAFHVGVLHVSGGFIGVDVFFVISGYLISSIIFSEIEASRFSIAAFYERRIRRIFPALFAMLLVYSVFAYIFLLPGELINFGKSLLATTLSGSNFYFWKESGYFDHRNADPLLHTWSLAVEEQFYILFPVFLLLARHFLPRRLRSLVAGLFFCSLILSAVVVSKNPDAAFYLPWTRAWELMLGTLVALGVFPPLRQAWLRGLVAALGIGMILYANYFFSPHTVFPGPSALVPCLGSVLIIGSGVSGKSLVHDLLSWRPLVFIGLISYSLYLWHWPVIIVYRMGILNISSWFEHRFGAHFAPDRFDHVVIILTTLVLATLSWRFVELPFRKGRLRTVLPRRRLFGLAAMSAACFVAFALSTIGSGGLKYRFSPETRQVASYLDTEELSKDESAQRLGVCFVDATTGTMNFNFDYCLRQKPGVKNYLLIGDSHAAAIWPALQSAFANANVMQVNVTSCIPTISLGSAQPLCRKVMEYVYGTYLPANRVDGLILEADWSAGDLQPLDETLRWATRNKIPVIVLGSVPQYDAPLARLLAYSRAWHKPELASEHRLGRDAALDKQLRSLVVDKWHFQFASPYAALCEADTCIEYADEKQGIPLMDDRHHFNRYGARFVVDRMMRRGELPDVESR